MARQELAEADNVDGADGLARKADMKNACQRLQGALPLLDVGHVGLHDDGQDVGNPFVLARVIVLLPAVVVRVVEGHLRT